MNMNVSELKEILKDLPDDMDVIIPVGGSLEDVNYIEKFAHVRTAGILSNDYENKPALCLNSAQNGVDISTQVLCTSSKCEKVLF